MPIDPHHLETSLPTSASYDAAVAEFEREMICRTNRDMRGRAAHVIHAALVERLQGRLPGVPLNDRNLRKAARAISNGTLRKCEETGQQSS
jgi:hypothetical protein